VSVPLTYLSFTYFVPLYCFLIIFSLISLISHLFFLHFIVIFPAISHFPQSFTVSFPVSFLVISHFSVSFSTKWHVMNARQWMLWTCQSWCYSIISTQASEIQVEIYYLWWNCSTMLYGAVIVVAGWMKVLTQDGTKIPGCCL